MPIHSIIIPTLTKTDTHFMVLMEAIGSIQDNSHDYELIIVDDGSPIDIGDVRFECDFYLRHKTNKGIAVSWNDGIRLAHGKYITIVNDDITVEKGWLDKLRVALEDDDDNWVAAPGVRGKENGTGIVQDFQWFPGYCFMVEKAFFDTYGLFDERFSPYNFEDTDMWTRVLKEGKKLVRNYSTTITHREGHVLHTLDYDIINKQNHEKFIEKWGFDPIPVFYNNKPFDFTKL